MHGRRFALRRNIFSGVLFLLAISMLHTASGYAIAEGSQITADNTFLSVSPAVFYYPQNETAWVFWSTQGTDGNFDIYYRIVSPNCLQNACLTFFYPTHRLTNGPRGNQFTSVTQTADGRVWVFFASDRISNATLRSWGVFYKIFNGTSWSRDFRLATGWNGTDVNPSAISFRAQGSALGNNIWVAWGSDHNCVCFSNIWLDSYNGTTWSPPRQITSNGRDFTPSLSQASNGTVWVSWARGVTGARQRDLYYETISPAGVVSQEHLIVSTSGVLSKSPSVVNVKNSSAIALVWSSNAKNPSRIIQDLYMKYSLNGGATWTPATGGIQLNSNLPSPQDDSEPQAVQTGSGRISIAYTSNITGTPNIFSMSLLIADVGLTTISPSQTIIGQGQSLKFNVTMVNYGWEPESPVVSLIANGTVVQTIRTDVPYQGTRLVTFVWDTSAWPKGSYIVKAVEANLTGESNPSNNIITMIGNIKVTIPGDVNGDRIVNVLDLVLVSLVFGSVRGGPRYDPNMDLNHDGVINILDLAYVAIRFGSTG
jgi:hypothetical protein